MRVAPVVTSVSRRTVRQARHVSTRLVTTFPSAENARTRQRVVLRRDATSEVESALIPLCTGSTPTVHVVSIRIWRPVERLMARRATDERLRNSSDLPSASIAAPPRTKRATRRRYGFDRSTQSSVTRCHEAGSSTLISVMLRLGDSYTAGHFSWDSRGEHSSAFLFQTQSVTFL